MNDWSRGRSLKGTLDKVERVPSEVGEFYKGVGPSIEGTPFGDWEQMAASRVIGWGYETPVGVVPMPPMKTGKVLDFVEELEKPWPKDDPRRSN